MTGDTDDCEECITAAALLKIAAVRDNLYRIMWAELPAVGGIDRAIMDLRNARRMLVATGVEQ